MPSTIANALCGWSTYYPQQIRVFRNPRGLKYYYALVGRYVSLVCLLDLYKSADGINWVLSANLYSGSLSRVGSVDWFDDGAQLIVYVTYGYYVASAGADPIYYRRLRIPDDQSDPIIGAEQIVVPAGGYGVPVIKRDRNGYVHIAYMARRTATIKGTTYPYAEPMIIGTTTLDPGDSPSWCTSVKVDTHPDIAFNSDYARCSLVMFGGTGNIGGLVSASRNSSGVIILRGRNIVSFDGTTYALGTSTTIVSSDVSTSTVVDVGFRVLADSSHYAHLLTERTLSNARVQSLKASALYTVQSWASPLTVDNSNNSCTKDMVSLSIDKTVTPNRLYAFYVFDAVQTNILRCRSSPTDTISWSSENTVVDDTTSIYRINSCYERTVSGVQIIYTLNTSPSYPIRFYEVVFVVPFAGGLNPVQMAKILLDL